MIPIGALVLSSHLLIAVADMVPNIDLKKTCSDAATVSGASTQDDINSCLTDERHAHDELVKQWAQYPGTAKGRCVRASSDYLPSYVELLTCVEMGRDAKGLPEE